MNIKVNIKLKIISTTMLIILIAISSYVLYIELKTLRYEEQKNSIYTYTNENTIDYEVYLKPNNLYDIKYLEEGEFYITEYVDYIKADLNYEFIGEGNAEISGDYSVVAKIKGHTGDGEKQLIIWERDFPTIKSKNFKRNDKSLSINEEINIRLEEYNNFAKEIIESSKINCQTTLNVIMNVNLKADTDKGPIEEKLSTNLVIPLNVSMFEIGGNNIVEKSGAIEETIQMQLPPNRNKVMLFAIIIGILLLALVFLIFFTTPAPVKDPLEKELNKIFKKHGDRLVGLNNDLEYFNGSLSIVKSIDDLVKIADEIEKPILYKYSDDYKEINKFYIEDVGKVYLLDLCELIPQNDSEGDREKLTVYSEQQEEVSKS